MNAVSHSAAAELVDAVKAIGAVEKLTAIAVGAHNPAQLTAVRGRLIQKALHAAVVAARYALPPPVYPLAAQEPATPRPEPAPEGASSPNTIDLAEPQPDRRTLREARAEWERDWLAARLAEHNGNQSAAAAAAGLDRAAAHRKMKSLGVAKVERDHSRPIKRPRKPAP